MAPSPAADAHLSSSCRVGPDGAALIADRGIGGTGGPLQIAERGIGGTGSPVKGIISVADRGIGGTGIIGVITGFASVCLAGQEVALPPDVTVAVDRLAASPAVLRAGQVAVIDAAGEPAGLRARSISIHYEVVGRVERVGTATIRVAGQDAVLSPQTWGARPNPGDWVAISGLRRADNVIEATRVDLKAPGQVVISGMLVGASGGLYIGALTVSPSPAAAALVGREVTVTGQIGPDGALRLSSIAPDLLATDPAAYFGPQVGVVMIESFAVLDRGFLRLAPGFSAPAPGLHLLGPQRGVFRFERAGGGLLATGVGDRLSGAIVPRGFEPAPVPDRGMRPFGSTMSNPPEHPRSPGTAARFGRDRGNNPLGFSFPPAAASGGGGPPRGR